MPGVDSFIAGVDQGWLLCALAMPWFHLLCTRGRHAVNHDDGRTDAHVGSKVTWTRFPAVDGPMRDHQAQRDQDGHQVDWPSASTTTRVHDARLSRAAAAPSVCERGTGKGAWLDNRRLHLHPTAEDVALRD